MGRILEEIVRKKSMTTPVDYVFCSGYFLEKVKLYSYILHYVLNQIHFIDLAFKFFKTGRYICYRTKTFTHSSNQKSCHPSYLMKLGRSLLQVTIL